MKIQQIQAQSFQRKKHFLTKFYTRKVKKALNHQIKAH